MAKPTLSTTAERFRSMRELRTKKVTNVVLVAVLLFGMTSVAVADDFTSSPTGPVTTTTTVAVWVAAVHGEGPWDKNSNGLRDGPTAAVLPWRAWNPARRSLIRTH